MMTFTSHHHPHDGGRFWLPLVILLALVFAVAAIGGAVTASSVGTWYQSLAKPSINPPEWIFGPVWSALYGMMAVAGALVWRRGPGRGGATRLSGSSHSSP